MHVGSQFTSENYTNNFFGYGNETKNNDGELGLNFNRVKTGVYALNAGVFKKGDFGSNYGVRAVFEGIEIEDTENRFIADFVPISNSNFYKRRFFGGLEAQFDYQSYDDKINPKRGMVFNFQIGGKTEFKETKNTYGYLNSSVGFYNALTTNKELVLTMESFLAAEGSFEYILNNDIWVSIKTRTLPFQIGVFGGADVGRVWLKNDFSEKWHNDYGGGFWITAAESLSGTFNFFNSVEGLRFSFAFGLNF